MENNPTVLIVWQWTFVTPHKFTRASDGKEMQDAIRRPKSFQALGSRVEPLSEQQLRIASKLSEPFFKLSEPLFKLSKVLSWGSLLMDDQESVDLNI